MHMHNEHPETSDESKKGCSNVPFVQRIKQTFFNWQKCIFYTFLSHAMWIFGQNLSSSEMPKRAMNEEEIFSLVWHSIDERWQFMIFEILRFLCVTRSIDRRDFSPSHSWCLGSARRLNSDQRRIFWIFFSRLLSACVNSSASIKMSFNCQAMHSEKRNKSTAKNTIFVWNFLLFFSLPPFLVQ